MGNSETKVVRVSKATHDRLGALSKTLSKRASALGKAKAEVTLASVVEAALDLLEEKVASDERADVLSS